MGGRKTILKNASVVNEGSIQEVDLLISNGFIERIDLDISDAEAEVEDLEGLFILPGIIDDQVHFREPGLTHKANIYTEARAAVAGGVTTFMEMPNTKPPALTIELLEEKYAIANRVSLANYSFFMGVSNDNLTEALKADPLTVCGLKIFMGSSTGNMLVDDPQTLDAVFKHAHLLIATHCEDEDTINQNFELYHKRFGDDIPPHYHPIIRNTEGCFLSSSMAVALAKKYNSRLHILHISTAKEIELFSNDTPRKEKRITAEACVHHMTFNDTDYNSLGHKIKCNPAIKSEDDRKAIFQAVLDGTIDIIATDHAPHTIEEKNNVYTSAPSGLPLVQHSLPLMTTWVEKGALTLEQLVDKMCHAPADIFQVDKRGYIREGYHADLVVIDINKQWKVMKENIHYKCGWSPLEGRTLSGEVRQTYVNGNLVYRDGQFDESIKGERLQFDR